MKQFELVQVHEANNCAEVVIRDKNGCLVYAGNLPKANNPKSYYPPKTERIAQSNHQLLEGLKEKIDKQLLEIFGVECDVHLMRDSLRDENEVPNIEYLSKVESDLGKIRVAIVNIIDDYLDSKEGLTSKEEER